MPRPVESHSRGERSMSVRVCLCASFTHVSSDVRARETECDLCTGMQECVCKTPVCVPAPKLKKKANPTIWKCRYTSEQQTEASQTLQILQKLTVFPPKIRTFVVPPHICMHSTGANNTAETAEHKQQQPHNEAVNKDDVSTSLCFPANKQNGFRTPFRGKNHERERHKQPSCYLWKAPGKDF